MANRINKLNLSLTRTGLNKPTSDTASIQDISTDEMTRTVKLGEISNYERNPRLHANTAYEQLKDSLKSSGGFKGTLEATVVPDHAGFVTFRGGGTRLQALKELFDETRDPAFNRIKIVVLPYPGEAQLIANHLSENENRGDLSFIERALGVIDLKRAMDADETEPLSDAEFARRATEIGFKINRTRMPVYRFAADKLHPIIPNALPSWGRRQVETVMAMRKALDAYGQSAEDNEVAETVWITTMVDLDRRELDLDRIHRALADCLAKQQNLDGGDARAVLNPNQNRGVPVGHFASKSQNSVSARTNSPLKHFPEPLHNCVVHDDELTTFNVTVPSPPFDTDADDYPATCLSWHLLKRLDPTCRSRQETIDTKIGSLTPEILSQLDNDQLYRVFSGFNSLHKRLAKRDADNR